jgi:hypothetical protein
MENIGNIKDVFFNIFKKNHWGGADSVSGPGSDLTQTKILIEKLPILFKEYKIKSVLDIPCGDFYWMSNVDLSDIVYTGADIVDDIIYQCKSKYPLYDFKIMDLVNSELPNADLIFCRDCLAHLPYEMIKKAIINIKKSKSKYLLTTSFTNHDNIDTHLGGWRPLNLVKEPFNFPDPILIINEGCTENNNEYLDKSMYLWKIKHI